jgi:hypothetical protein
MQLDVLPGKTVPGVRQALPVFTLVYHLVRLGLCPSATRPPRGVERISCLETLRWLGAPSTRMPFQALVVNPPRAYRVEPRVKQRRPKPFPVMITPRQARRQQLTQQACRR